MDHQTDEEIIRLVLNGGVDEFRHLVRRHQQMAYRTAYSVIREHEAAEEVTQDSFLKAYSALSRFEGRSRFATWLFRIVYHRALNYLEASQSYKKYIQLDVPIDEEYVFTDDNLASLYAKDQGTYIRLALDRLSAEDRVALNLYYLEELSQPEISEMTGWSLASTKQRIHRARARLDNALHLILNTEKKDLL